jgi:hypothetical protein
MNNISHRHNIFHADTHDRGPFPWIANGPFSARAEGGAISGMAGGED